jgi:nitroimidazol reductase NimA-like FMN-containing flavoprotein (pyridoxamine 5'-phosphate oxidase superfamily)
MGESNQARGSNTPASASSGKSGKRVLERLDEAECLQLIADETVGRLAYTGRYGPTVLPVNYRMHEGSVVFRTAQDSPTDEDLRTGIAHAEYQVAFEIDRIDPEAREGWSVLVQGSAHHVDTDEERAAVASAEVEPWPEGEREHFIRIHPARITGRRIRRP